MSISEATSELVSIVIPCYNAAEYVGEAIESALNQTYEAVEVIVIDDGSSDGSREVIRSFGDRITWHTGPNRGACAARNTGWKISSGEFIKFLDADDMLDAEIVSAQVAHARDHEAADGVVYSHTCSMGTENDHDGQSEYAPPEKGEDRILHFLENNIQTSCPLHRRHLLESAGGFDEELNRAQEYDLHLRLATTPGIRFCYLDKVAAYIRVHGDPDRISNVDFDDREPLSAYRRSQKRVEFIEDLTGEPLSEPVRRHIARDLWKSGRQVLRYGHSEAADVYFDEAKKLHCPQYVVGSLPYRLLVRALGPRRAERVGEQTKGWVNDTV